MEHKVKLADRKIKMVVKDLNKVLDQHQIFGAEFNMEVIKALILDNLTVNQTTELMKRIDETPISEWRD